METFQKTLREQFAEINEGYINCTCDDLSCDHKRGLEGEVAGHIEDCSCDHCNRYYSGDSHSEIQADSDADNEAWRE
jgi:hypothetical protein